LQLKELKEEANVVDSRLRATSYQVGLIWAKLSRQDIPIKNDADSSDDSDQEFFDIIYSEFHCPTSPLP
jgi:hypothetical protein